MATDTRPDAELVTAWAAGDQSAFAAVYDRYADALYAFALSRLRDQAAAADAVQDTFLRAARRVDQLRDRTRLRAWLYAIARNQVIDAVRRPALLAATELDDMTSDERDPADVAAANDAAALLHDAALGLNERDRELLDLHLRHGLDGADLADVAGLSRPQSYVAMNRLRGRLAKAIGIVLVARHGSRDCSALAQVLRGWDGRFTLEMRSRVTRHVEGCDECSRRRTKLLATVQLSPGALGIPLLVAPARLRETTIERVAAVHSVSEPPPATAAVVHVGSAATWRRDGFPVAPDGGGHRRAAALIGAAALIVALVAGVLLARRDDGAADAEDLRPAPGSAVTTGIATSASFRASASTSTVVLATTTSTTVTGTTSPPATTVAETSSTVTESLPAAPGDTEPAVAAPDGTAPDPPDPDPPAGPAPEVADDSVGDLAPQEQTLPPEPPAAAETTMAAPPAPPDPGHIVVLSDPVTLGASASGGSVRIRNDGGQPAAWSAAMNNGAFGVSPSSGSLEPGQEADLAVGVDRSGLPEGAHTASITVAAEHGGGAANVSATVERPPSITAFGRTPPVVRTSSSCGPTLVSVSVTATDESPIGSATIQWSSDGTFAQLTELSPNGAGAYTGQVGSFTSAGAHNLRAIVTDARGNTSTETTTVSVIPC